ncbi:hypothetical protein OsJ_36958 [Oryza sativa Japonica Group]|uniref:Thaumatin-like protein n=1 Tax=Oryza sativa subsp. japonica TaxID=39947 RepID=A3CJP2_ORYSJ|nr:hypothetical protein OsJ_36958 [Oryza sativa Japonica Group]
MASAPAASSAVLLVVVLVASLAAGGANAATFTITNRCSFTVWPGGDAGGRRHAAEPGADVDHQRARRDQLRQGVGPDRVQLRRRRPRQPPLTLAEFTLGTSGGNRDFYNLSVIDGYNVAMSFSCSSGVTLTCRERSCPDAYQYPSDDSKLRSCNGNSNYRVVFCP